MNPTKVVELARPAVAAPAVPPARRASALVRLRRMGIDTYQTPVIYMRRACAVCRAEGFEAQSRIEVRRDGRQVVATLNVVTADLLSEDEAGLSEAAWRLLDAHEGDTADLRHAPQLESLGALRAKVSAERAHSGAGRRHHLLRRHADRSGPPAARPRPGSPGLRSRARCVRAVGLLGPARRRRRARGDHQHHRACFERDRRVRGRGRRLPWVARILDPGQCGSGAPGAKWNHTVLEVP